MRFCLKGKEMITENGKGTGSKRMDACPKRDEMRSADW